MMTNSLNICGIKKYTHALLVIASFVFSTNFCITKNENYNLETVLDLDHANHSANEEDEVGIFNMGLLRYEIIDPSLTSPEKAQLIVDGLTTQLKYDVVYNAESIATIKYNTDGSIYNRQLYVYEDGAMYEYLYKGKNKYFCKLGHHSKDDRTSQDSLLFKYIFKRDEKADKTIFGYPCSKVYVVDPIVSGKVLTEAYIAEGIPYINKGFGNIGSNLLGLPLEISMDIQGVRIYTGATNHQISPSLKLLLQVNSNSFTEMDIESFRELKER